MPMIIEVRPPLERIRSEARPRGTSTGTTAQPTGDIGPGEGSVPGDGGDGTSMSGACGGIPGGGSVGWPGCDGSGVVGAGVVGGSCGWGCCCMKGSNAPENRQLPAIALPHGACLL